MAAELLVSVDGVTVIAKARRVLLMEEKEAAVVQREQTLRQQCIVVQKLEAAADFSLYDFSS